MPVIHLCVYLVYLTDSSSITSKLLTLVLHRAAVWYLLISKEKNSIQLNEIRELTHYALLCIYVFLML